MSLSCPYDAPTLLSLSFRGFRSATKSEKDVLNLVREANQAVKRRNLFVRHLLEHYDEIFEKDAGTPMTPGIFRVEEAERHVPSSPCTPSSDEHHPFKKKEEEEEEQTVTRPPTPPPVGPTFDYD